MTAQLRGRTGSNQSAGTGFFYQAEVSTPGGDGNVLFLVTNKHVVAGARDEMSIRMIRAADDGASPRLGEDSTFVLTNPRASFIEHPDPAVDVALVPFNSAVDELTKVGAPPFFKSIGTEHMLTSGVAEELDSLEQVIFVGYPNALYDQANLTPIMRSGSTATPIMLDYNGEPAFLIDASVFPGSSGSPVFLLDRGGTTVKRDGSVHVGINRSYLLGVVAAVHTAEVHGELRQLPTRLGLTMQDPLNLGIVYKASAITECADIVIDRAGFARRTPDPVDRQEPPAEAAA